MDLLKDIAALLITNPTNIRYLTGFIGVATEEREVFALLTQDQLFLFTNSLYLEAARKLSNPTNNPIKCVEISRENPLSKKLAKISQEEKIKRLGFEENDLTVAEFLKLKKELRGIRLISTKNRIEELRMIKREDEIENIRQAAKITDECFDFILGKIRPDVTENKITWEIESFFHKRGAQNAFSPIVAFGTHTSQPHYTPNFIRPRLEIEARQGEALKNQDIALLDFGARVNGYCSDMTRVVFIGKPRDDWMKAYKTVVAAQQAALDFLHLEGVKAHLPGGVQLSGTAADRIARKIIKNAGFPTYPHSLGHGVGLDIHEAPRLMINPSVSSGQALKPAMVVTIEPAVYVEGSYGIRIEDLVLLRKDGIEILSKSTKKLTIL